MKAFGYVRASSATQKKGTSINRQEVSIRNYCHQNNINLIDIYSDYMSGYLPLYCNGWTRHGWSMMMKELKKEKHKDTLIVVESLDRISRNISDLSIVCFSEYNTLRTVYYDWKQCFLERSAK